MSSKLQVNQQRVTTFQTNLKRIADFNKQNTKLKYTVSLQPVMACVSAFSFAFFDSGCLNRQD
jgi:hypothetical protein